MKIYKKALALFVVVLVMTVLAPAAFAVSNTSAEPGKTATLTFKFEDVFNVDGTFTVNDADGIVSKYTISVTKAGATSAVVNGDRLWAAPIAEPVSTDVSVAVKVTLKSNAAVGKTCTVSFAGVYGDGAGKPGNEKDVYQSGTVTVKAATVKPVIDYTELKKQIGIAEDLTSKGYTADSWKNMTDALAAAKTALKSTDQAKVDASANTLKDAIAALVKVDYSKLVAALDGVDAYAKSDDLAGLWKQLADAFVEGKGLLASDDQSAVDASAAKITGLLDQIKKAMDELKKEPETIIKEVEKEVVKEVEKEVKVEVLPEGDYCNIEMHRVWPILFFVSLGLNVILAVAFGAVIAKKKKNRKDDTPLVDYDIGDDA